MAREASGGLAPPLRLAEQFLAEEKLLAEGRPGAVGRWQLPGQAGEVRGNLAGGDVAAEGELG